jgi:ribosome-associated translation inhibitor RaiA
MARPLEIVLKGMEHSEAVEARIHEKAEKLFQLSDRITRCRVLVEAPTRHHQHGSTFSVHIDLHVPGSELVVNRDGTENPAHADVYVALRDAFAAAKRQLLDHKGSGA